MQNKKSRSKPNSQFAERRRRQLASKRNKKEQKTRLMSNTPSQEELALLFQYYQSGSLNKAMDLCTQITKRFPTHGYAWKILGVVLTRIGKKDEALVAKQKAVQFSPNDAESHNLLGVNLRQAGRLNEAEQSFRKAIALKSDAPQFHNNLGLLLQQQGQLTAAEASCRQAIKLDPDYAEAYNSLGITLYHMGRLADAEQILMKAITLNSDLAVAYNNLALTLLDMNRPVEAETICRRAIALKPDYAEAHSNLGMTLQELGRMDEVEASYNQAIALKPNYAEAYSNLGVALEELGRMDEAEASHVRAIALDPQLISTHKNLALLYTSNKQYDKARDCFKKALAIDPNFADIKFDLALYYLRLKDFSAGFKLYEARYHPKITETRVIKPNITIPQYHGTNLFHDIKGKHLLICPEQGVGDEVMFASLLPELSSLVRQYPSTRITLACDPRLVDLFNHSFNFLTAVPRPKDNSYQTIEKGLDYWLFIGSLPKLFRTKIEDFSNHQPYLLPNNKLIDVWRSRFDRLPHKTNIGISWKGGSGKKASKVSLSLEKMLPILSKASLSANIINLQYGDHQQEIEEFQENTGITIFDWDDCDPLKDLSNFSAQIKALDLVISIDTATVEFCGAIGTNTYVLLPFNQDWRWGEDNSESYWHPNILTSYRQTKNGDWDSVIQTVANIL